MNVVIITDEQFPYGNAATNRLLTYLPGLVSLGHKVTILCLHLTREENATLLDQHASCVHQGVTIRYMRGRKTWPFESKNYFKKAFLKIKGFLKPIFYLIKNGNKIDIVQVCSTKINLYEHFGWWCKTLGIKYAIERSELPDIIKKKDKFESTTTGQKYIKRSQKAFGLFDGWILETQNLVDYYSRFFSSHAEYVIVPMTVDVERFNKEKQTTTRYGQYIGYCGNMSEVDGISILIKAYALIKDKFPEIKLVLAGSSDEVPAQKKLAKELMVEDRVIFAGRLTRDEVPQFLADAQLLVLASPTSERACATMPCKVGEYLCTGNPVVVTGLGELNKYLKDGESAFLAKADSEETFAEKMLEALKEPEKASIIGKKGKQVAIDNFSSEVQVERIDSFYHKLIRS